MHDLNTINRLNAEAFADSIAKYRAAGRFVLAKYEGVHLVSIETFTDTRQAQDALDAALAEQHGGARAVLFTPIPAPADVTLADYINRKTI